MSDDSHIAEQLVAARLARKLTQVQAAAAIGMSDKALRSAEKTGRVPKKRVRQAIERTYRVSIWPREPEEIPDNVPRDTPKPSAGQRRYTAQQAKRVAELYVERRDGGADADELATLRTELLFHIRNGVQRFDLPQDLADFVIESFFSTMTDQPIEPPTGDAKRNKSAATGVPKHVEGAPAVRKSAGGNK